MAVFLSRVWGSLPGSLVHAFILSLMYSYSREKLLHLCSIILSLILRVCLCSVCLGFRVVKICCKFIENFPQDQHLLGGVVREEGCETAIWQRQHATWSWNGPQSSSVHFYPPLTPIRRPLDMVFSLSSPFPEKWHELVVSFFLGGQFPEGDFAVGWVLSHEGDGFIVSPRFHSGPPHRSVCCRFGFPLSEPPS